MPSVTALAPLFAIGDVGLDAPYPAGFQHCLQQVFRFVEAEPGARANNGGIGGRRSARGARFDQHFQYRHCIDEGAAGRCHMPPAFVFNHRQRRRDHCANQDDEPTHIDPDQKYRNRGQRAVNHRVAGKTRDEDGEQRLAISKATAAMKPPQPALRHSTKRFGMTIYSKVNASVVKRSTTPYPGTR